ncbi:hypothetical protein ABKN59_002939 [Abortiporus biennis]
MLTSSHIVSILGATWRTLTSSTNTMLRGYLAIQYEKVNQKKINTPGTTLPLLVPKSPNSEFAKIHGLWWISYLKASDTKFSCPKLMTAVSNIRNSTNLLL